MHVTQAKIMIFIKPWDQQVYENLFVMLGTIAKL